MLSSYYVCQFLYGEDGLDIGKSQYLNDKGIPFLVANKDCVRLTDPNMLDRDEDGEVKAAQKAVSLESDNRMKSSSVTALSPTLFKG